jgi:hypothetical protein
MPALPVRRKLHKAVADRLNPPDAPVEDERVADLRPCR